MVEIDNFQKTSIYALFISNKQTLLANLNYALLESLSGDELVKALGEQRSEIRNMMFYDEVKQEIIEEMTRRKQPDEPEEEEFETINQHID